MTTIAPPSATASPCRCPAGWIMNCGKVPPRAGPTRSNLIHYNWHWFWHWGTGEALNNGTHEVDVCRWALGVDWPIARHLQRRPLPVPGRLGNARHPGHRLGFRGGQDHHVGRPELQRLPDRGPGTRAMVIYGTDGSAAAGRQQLHHFRQEQEGRQSSSRSGSVADPTNTISATGIDMDPCTSRILLRPSGRARRPTPPSAKATRAWPCCTWATSPGVSAASCTGPRQRPHPERRRRHETLAPRLRPWLGAQSLTRFAMTNYKFSMTNSQSRRQNFEVSLRQHE